MIIFYCCLLLITYLFNMYFICLFLGLCFALHIPQDLIVLKDFTLTDVDFYEKISKDDWDSFDFDKKNRVFNDFLKNELGYYDALKKGVDLDPKTAKALKTRKEQVLLNNTYEHLIARPLADSLEIQKNRENLKHKAEAYHILIGYKNSKQNTESTISQERAGSLADSLYFAIKKESLNRDIEVVFKEFALNFSIDPSVKENSGFLGWVPWGRTVMSFQEPLFSLKNRELSSPVHTEYGYHLILKTGFDRSSHFYYSEKTYKDLSVKLALGSLPFDSLKTISSNFDTLMINNSNLSFNSNAVDSIVSFILIKKQQDRLAGNKNQLISWLETNKKTSLLFTINKKGFGVGWLLEKLKQTPSSRIPPIKTKKDLKDLILFFVLQDEVVSLGYKNNISSSVSFKRDWKNNKQNIVYNEYLSFLLNSQTPIDSVLVEREYKKQALGSKLLKPKRVVFSEIRVFNLNVAKNILVKIEEGFAFDTLLEDFGGSIKEPVSKSKGSPLALALFDKKPGFISNIIENNDGSFSIARIERFLEEELFSFDLVYNKLEREIISTIQDSIKVFLLENLQKSLRPKINYSVIGL